MRKSTIVTALCAAFLLPLHPASAACGGHGNRDTMLVSTTWLADHLRDPNLVILSIGDQKDYDAGHIPGALYVNYMDTHVMTSSANLTLELLPEQEAAEVFAKLGVSNDSRIVLYFSNDWASPTTRVFLTLDAMGLGAQTSLLDGGYPVWKKEGRPVSTEVRKVTPGKLVPCAQDDVIASLDYVRANLHHAGVDIIDARDPEYYSGAKAGRAKRAGHIPGATNLTYSTLLDDNGKMKPREVLASMFQKAGVKPGDRVVSYCHIGQQATVIYFAARYLGFDARLYDGSWEDWSAHADLPAETSPAK